MLIIHKCILIFRSITISTDIFNTEDQANTELLIGRNKDSFMKYGRTLKVNDNETELNLIFF